jgi:iron complex transport system substrate-binding protein
MRSTPKRVPSVLVAALALAGCAAATGTRGGSAPAPSSGTSQAGFPVTVSSCGNRLTFDHPAERVVTIGSDAALVVAAAGGASRIVQRSSEGGAPLGRYTAVLGRVPEVAANTVPAAESILAKRPDLVVSYELSNYAGLRSVLGQAGVTVLVPGWRCATGTVTFPDIYRQIDDLGRVLGTRRTADETVASLGDRARVVEQRFAGAAKRTGVVLYVSDSGLKAYGNRSLDDAVLGAVGLTNVFGDVNRRDFDINLEELLTKDPDVIVATYGGEGTAVKTDQRALQALRRMPGVSRLRAVARAHVIPLNFGYLVGGPLAVDGLETIADALASFK